MQRIDNLRGQLRQKEKTFDRRSADISTMESLFDQCDALMANIGMASLAAVYIEQYKSTTNIV